MFWYQANPILNLGCPNHCLCILGYNGIKPTLFLWGFPVSSAGNKSTCNAGDPGSSSASVRSPGERIGYPLQYFWVFLVVQMVKNPPAMQEIWVRSLSWEDPWRRAWQPTPVFLPGESPWTRGASQATVHGVAKSQT